jgi:hypothetical protein
MTKESWIIWISTERLARTLHLMKVDFSSDNKSGIADLLKFINYRADACKVK